MKNIVLIGFMGTGKTTIGRRLAERLGRPFIDTDAAIEEVTGKTITQLFARDGAARFRSEEALLAKKLAGREGLVVATGGGMVLNPENVRLLKENGVLIALTAGPEVIHQRVRNIKNRPLLGKGDQREALTRLLKERAGVYDIAALTIDTGCCSQEQAVDEITRFLDGEGLLL
ncbi:MAG: shikimate kinase [Peptococcaceae bacterium]|nr:MAG: shikimate kinase [Peptococcaceae bacterium]